MAEVIRTKVRGVTHYQKACGLVVSGQPLQLKREPDNTYDSNAIAVLTRHGLQIGYVAQELASDIAGFMDAEGEVTAVVMQTTGGTKDRPTIGVNIKLVVHRDFEDDSSGDIDIPAWVVAEKKNSSGRLWKVALWTFLLGGIPLALLLTCTG